MGAFGPKGSWWLKPKLRVRQIQRGSRTTGLVYPVRWTSSDAIVTVLSYPSHSEEIMPTVSESLAKLSQRAKEAEDHAATARNETREQLEARAAAARATAQRRREELKARGAKMQDDLASAWASLLARAQEQFETIRAKLEEKRDDHDAKAAERRAERAEANAADAIDFASWAVDEAEAEALEAVEARKIADALHPS
jgi:hypothetical protein